jgi:hypothetical protein
MSGSILAGLALDSTLTGGTQETQVVDAAGNPAGSLDCTGLRGLAVAQSGTFYAQCPGNTTTAQLAASATFTGTVENIFNQQTISVIGVCDQPLTVTVRQFIDAGGTKQVSIQTFTTTAGVGFNRAIAGCGNFFRITAQNTGGATTTTLHIDTVAGTLQPQTQTGNLPASISEIDPAVTFPLPTGAATSANQTNGNQRTQIASGANNAAVSSGGALSTQVVDQTAAISLTTPTNSTSGSITGVSQAATVTIQLTGTFSATAQVQITRDGSTWVNVTGSNSIINVATGAYIASGNLTAVGVYQMDVAGVAGVRLILTAWTSGTITGTVGVTAAPAMVSIEGVPAVTVSSGTITTLTTCSTVTTVNTVSSVTSANLNFPSSVTDVASAALSTLGLTNSATMTPTFGCSYIVAIPVTAATGTTPTLDVSIEESDDAGTNWRTIYQFPRITTTGIYRSPKLPCNGNRVRYAQTVGGTSPSFTRAINRLQCSDSVNVYRQAYDRAVSLTTLNATTSTLDVQGCSGVQLVINLGAATTAPTLALEASDDGGASWYVLGTILGVASSTVQITIPGISPQLIRGRVSVVGATVTAGYVLIRGY